MFYLLNIYIATVYDVAVHGENTIENLNSHYVLTSAEHGQLRQGSYQKILLIRLRDREEYYVMVQHFCVDGSRLPLHLLHTHASILPVGKLSFYFTILLSFIHICINLLFYLYNINIYRNCL